MSGRKEAAIASELDLTPDDLADGFVQIVEAGQMVLERFRELRTNQAAASMTELLEASLFFEQQVVPLIAFYYLKDKEDKCRNLLFLSRDQIEIVISDLVKLIQSGVSAVDLADKLSLLENRQVREAVIQAEMPEMVADQQSQIEYTTAMFMYGVADMLNAAEDLEVILDELLTGDLADDYLQLEEKIQPLQAQNLEIIFHQILELAEAGGDPVKVIRIVYLNLVSQALDSKLLAEFEGGEEELRNKLESAWGKLTARQQLVLELRFYQGLDVNMISDMIADDAMSAKSLFVGAKRVVDAKKLLAEAISEFEQNFIEAQ